MRRRTNMITFKRLAQKEIKALKKKYPNMTKEDLQILCVVMANEVMKR